MQTDRPNILVLGAHNRAALPLIESAHAHGRRVIAGSPRRYCAGFYSRCVRERLRYPPADREPEACLEFLLRYVSRGHVDMLSPVGDSGTELVARHQDEFRRFTHLALPPYAVFQGGRDKIRTLQAAARAGVPIPRTWYPEEQPLETIAREASYPCLVKPAISAGARGMTVVGSAEDLAPTYEQVRNAFGRAFVQEFVPQTGMQCKADLVVGAGGRLLAGVVYNKLRYYPPTGGSSVLNETVHRPDVLDLAVRTVRELGWYGFSDFDFITDPRDGLVKLLEINPRFPESFRAVVAAGVDMAEIIYQMAHGREPEPQLQYRTGRYVRFLSGDILWFLTSRDRFKQLASWLDFFSPNVTYQIFSARDPGPLLGYLLENLMLDRRAMSSRLRLGQATH